MSSKAEEVRDYYGVLGVGKNATLDEIRRAYRKLAMRWHPDKWVGTPSHAENAKRKFQNIQEAYSVLSDGRKRSVYNAGLFDPTDEDEGFLDFVQEMFGFMEQVRNEGKTYGIGELQDMLKEMTDCQSQSQHKRGFGGPTSVRTGHTSSGVFKKAKVNGRYGPSSASCVPVAPRTSRVVSW